MEFFVERALSVGRLNSFQLDRLHELERSRGRLVYASEVTQMCHVKPVLEAWQIPDSERAKARSERDRHLRRVREALVVAGCIDGIYATMRYASVQAWHEFDGRVMAAIDENKLALAYERRVVDDGGAESLLQQAAS